MAALSVALGTTAAASQPLRLPTSMYSMKRMATSWPAKARTRSSTVWSLTPRCTTALSLMGAKPASCARAIPARTRSMGMPSPFIRAKVSGSVESRLTVTRRKPAARSAAACSASR